MDHTYWQKQIPGKPLYPDLEWSKPERRDQAGKLLIVGGNKLGFAAVAESYQTALKAGAGEVRVLVPDCLKKMIPAVMTDVLFSACTPSGGLSQDALTDLKASAAWANGVLLIGDAGRNSETSLVYESFIQSYDGPLTITRDAIDLVRNNTELLVERKNTVLILSFAQLQKIFQAVLYPKILTFNMQLLQLVEALHKFTVTYPCTIVSLHKDTLIIAHNGNVVTQAWTDPMAMWRGQVATNAASYWMWNSKDSLKSISTSVA